MSAGKDEGGRTDGVREVIFPVRGEIVRVAGEMMRVLSGRVRTARVETRTRSGVVWDSIVVSEGEVWARALVLVS